MIDPATYDHNETLKSGIAVRVRAIRADDKERLSEAFRNLEPDSIYTRFFHHKKDLTAAELKAATEVDFDKVVALVVTIGEKDDEIIIGSGRYVAFEATGGRRSAEVAFTVEEDYQGLGITSRLLQHLVLIAREKGIDRFEADVLSQNKAMLTVFSRSGLPMKKQADSGSMHITLTLTKTVA